MYCRQRTNLVLACRLIKQYRLPQHYYALLSSQLLVHQYARTLILKCMMQKCCLITLHEEENFLSHYQVHLTAKAFSWKDLFICKMRYFFCSRSKPGQKLCWTIQTSLDFLEPNNKAIAKELFCTLHSPMKQPGIQGNRKKQNGI